MKTYVKDLFRPLNFLGGNYKPPPEPEDEFFVTHNEINVTHNNVNVTQGK